jgi:hypothetical protein
MTRILRPNPRDLAYIEDVRADRRTLQRGATNDPSTDLSGRFYLNAARTSYLYLSGHDLYFVAPDSAAVKLN